MELELDFQVVLEMAERKGIKVRSHLGPLEPEEETLLRKALESAQHEEAPPPAEPEPPPPVVPTLEEERDRRLGELVQPAPTPEERAAEEKRTAAAAAARPPGVRDDKPGTKEGERRAKRRGRRGRRRLDGAEIIRRLRGSRIFHSGEKDEDETFSPTSRLGILRPARRPVKRRPKPTSRKAVPTVPPKDATVTVPLPISVKDLSQAMGIKAGEILGVLIQSGIMASINQNLDRDAVELIGVEFNREIKFKRARGEAELLEEEQVFIEEKPENLAPRPPVVTFLGHVDHGKTSLLDVIKKSNVQASEAGGITQHTSAYEATHKDKKITFLDTPGHAAFTEMRARGANVTDIAILVVAADDGVMPQTEEAINHARAAEVPILVALNKIDLPNANVMRAKQQLASAELLPEEFGGDVVVVETSASTEAGISDLLDMILLVAEMQDLRADPTTSARGHVLEARLTEGKGVVATLLVQSGTLRRGDFVLAGKAIGRVRALHDFKGTPVETAPPSMPVDILGLDKVPDAGDSFFAAASEERAKAIARERLLTLPASDTRVVSADNLYEVISAGKVQEIPLIIKADVKGSVEPLRNQLEAFSTPEVKIKVLHAGVGTITESDVLLAEASGALILGFHVILSDRIRSVVEENQVEVKLFDVIYQAVDEIKRLVEGEHKPLESERVTGHVEIRKVFKLSRGGNVAGCYVKDGTIGRKDFVRVLRGEEVLADRLKIGSLKRFQDDVKEVKEGFECGIKIAGFENIAEGDIIESFIIELVKRKLEDVLEKSEG
jgi:translation initiation factor IF-2